MVAQLVEDLVHLERREDRLDQDGAADVLTARPRERLGPEPRLEMRLELRQVEVTRTVEEGEAEVEEARGDGLALDEMVALDHVPAAWADQERRARGGDTARRKRFDG